LNIFPFSPFQNHNQDIITGLKAGIRGLNMNFGKCLIDGIQQLSLVRLSCIGGFSDPLEVLTGIHQFLSDNPNEVILMPSQIDDNTGGEVEFDEIYSVMQRVVNDQGRSMADLLYAHGDEKDPWPTLGELIAQDKRILFFVYGGSEDCEKDCPDGFHDWYTYAAETESSFTSVSNIKDDTAGACEIAFGDEGTRDFFGINVFIEFPSFESSAEVNTESFLGEHLDTCSSQNGLDPSLLLVDFWSEGDVLAVVHAHNEALVAPSAVPSSMPTKSPTFEPTRKPTPAPTGKPNRKPTPVPTFEPTREPTPAGGPTYAPSINWKFRPFND
jgi:hypothetical protein